jgi:SagB-type dehydrogenase family enzyme
MKDKMPNEKSEALIMRDTFREFLKDNIHNTIDFSQTDQNRGIEAPPIQKPHPTDAKRIDLAKPGEWKNILRVSVDEAIARRRSRREYSSNSMSMDELSFILWATQGIRGNPTRVHALRTVPSAGCRHALETYIAAFRVEGLTKALYCYLPMSHQLILLAEKDGLEGLVAEAASFQSFAGESAFTLIWTAIPYRMEWRYGLASFKLIALDAGHVCQNLYLACEAINAGTCAIAAYNQEKLDTLLGVDGDEEFAVYMAPVGKTGE